MLLFFFSWNFKHCLTLHKFLHDCLALTSGTDVTDVCMDENAVSSDPVLAFLLDEVVVKDWCKRKFKRIIHELSSICILLNENFLNDGLLIFQFPQYVFLDCSIDALGIEAMKDKMNLLQKFVLQLTGVSSVLEVMDASFKETLSAQLRDLHQLLESTLKAKQVWILEFVCLSS